MSLSTEEKNTIVGLNDDLAVEMKRIAGKMEATSTDLKTAENITKVDPIQTDLTKLTVKELQTRIKVLGKQHAQIANMDAKIMEDMKMVDKELTKRQ
jgi:uncharacterized protein YbaP (TraB family)